MRQRERVGDVALHAQRERLDAEEDLLGRERVERRAEVAKSLDAQLDGEGDVAERLGELEAVVALSRLERG